MRLGLVCLIMGALVACTSEDRTDDDGASSPAATGSGGGGGAAGAGGAPSDCAPGSRTGPAEGSVGELTPSGVDFNVRTPAGYDATAAHPLLVVYSPAGVTNPVQTEQFTGLTPDAIARGYLVAYV